MVRSLRAAGGIALFVDEYRSPLSGKNAAQGLLMALQKGPDILHLGGFERVSRYEFGQLMIRIFDIKHPVVTLCKQKYHKMAAPRPPDVSFDCTRAKKLGLRAGTIEDELKRIKNQW
jgi:dTDP-4-dehydrorhamnose reductase